MSEKIVCIIGVLDKEGSTNISMAHSFIRFGYQVIPVNYRTIISTKGHDYFHKYVEYIMNKFNPELTIFCKMNNVSPDIVDLCNKYSKTWLWNPDPIQTIQQCPEVLEHAKRSNFSSCTGGGTAKWFINNEAKNCYHIIDGLDYDVFKPIEPNDAYIADISFIGSRTEERDSYLKILKDNGVIVKAYGNGYDKEVINKEFTTVCASSKMMLSLNVHNDIPDYFSNRLLRYLGCGVCVLQLDKTGTLNKYFEDGEDLVLFKDDLIEKINSLTDEKIAQIAINGREKALNNYTWDHTVYKILNIILEK